MKTVLCLVLFQIFSDALAQEMSASSRETVFKMATDSGFQSMGNGNYKVKSGGRETVFNLENASGLASAQKAGFFPDVYQILLNFVDSKDYIKVKIDDVEIGEIKNGVLSYSSILKGNDEVKISFFKGKNEVNKRTLKLTSLSKFKCCFIKQAVCERY